MVKCKVWAILVELESMVFERSALAFDSDPKLVLPSCLEFVRIHFPQSHGMFGGFDMLQLHVRLPRATNVFKSLLVP